ncbi:MAG: hypothetical protein N2689_06725 [Verrucomicrobiae bacterium]|nr:hypothetical protein [Verrucomicrobiae bacterium]
MATPSLVISPFGVWVHVTSSLLIAAQSGCDHDAASRVLSLKGRGWAVSFNVTAGPGFQPSTRRYHPFGQPRPSRNAGRM